ncbi:hypothetical protein F5Y01DRAFT_314339 [Xylaria sp. FL0043]|nr:hypothetical protein F5Y01DRAFT_314339 [Xylaria sp. FL0043]
MDTSLMGILQRHVAEMDAAIGGVIDDVVRKSELQITKFRISGVTEDSFRTTIETNLKDTGPAKAKIMPMSVDLCGPSGRFAKVVFPEIKIKSKEKGNEWDVTGQMIKIIDKEALKAFVQAILRDNAVLSLRHGHTTLSALSVGPRAIVFDKHIGITGMKNLVVSVKEANVLIPYAASGSSTTSAGANPYVKPSPTSASLLSRGNTFAVVFKVTNPSPVQLSFGACTFDIEDHEGNTLAELRGRLDIHSGGVDIRSGHFDTHSDSFDLTFQGSVNKANAAKLSAAMGEHARLSAADDSGNDNGSGSNQVPEARFVGKFCASAEWCDDVVKNINLPLQNVRALFRALGVDYKDPPVDNRSSFMKWGEKFMARYFPVLRGRVSWNG